MTRQTLTERLAGGRGRRRQAAAAAGAIVVGAVVIGIIVSAGAPAASKGQNSASTAPGASTVQRRDLVQTDTESGTLGYANPQTVFNRLSGTITFLPAVGQVVQPGGTLYEVDGSPVTLFNGSYPAYRDLESSDSDGRDIQELNSDLKAMGFDPYDAITVDDAWQSATTAAVERFQASIGQTETGNISLGRIVFLPGSQLINAVDTTVGSTGASAGAGSGTPSGSGTGASYTGPRSTPKNVSYDGAGQSRGEFVDLTSSSTAAPPTTTTTPATTTPATTTPTATTPTTPATSTTPTAPGSAPTYPLSPGTPSSGLEAIIQLLQTQNKLLQAELKTAAKGSGSRSPSSTPSTGSPKSSSSSSPSSASPSSAKSPSSSSKSPSGSGNGGGTATPILSTTSTNLVVTVDLDATKQSEAKAHEPVTVQLPDGSTVNGRITSVSPVATTTNTGSNSSNPSSSAPSATIPVTISLDKHANTRGLDQAAVSVNFEAQVAKHVLSVPVTALLATQGGGYAVQLAAPPHRLVSVTPGLFAAGYVQISGPDIQDGMQVTDSQG
ncbi:MAG TPA: peptidoglycan-binding domain-containing protein [Solirubrobacteraceae bacterium]|nr:peptidoglycan-binding domain-containing protein [Solirubrobacteraceae bacterium]